MSQEILRRSQITLPLPGSPAALVGAATFIATRPIRISHIQLCLSDTGTGAGATTVVAKLNGVAIATQAALTIAQGAGSKALLEGVIGSVANYPNGQRVNKGDVVTVDVTAVPATTSPKSAYVVLAAIEMDV